MQAEIGRTYRAFDADLCRGMFGLGPQALGRLGRLKSTKAVLRASAGSALRGE